MPISLADFDVIEKDKKFNSFKWNELRMNTSEVFKLTMDNSILGLVYFFHEPIQNIIELNKIEVNNENVGNKKRFDYIAGCLIAFVCLQALNKMSGEVFIFYTSASKSIYLNKYGMQEFNQFYVKSNRLNSIKLVKRYLGGSTHP